MKKSKVWAITITGIIFSFVLLGGLIFYFLGETRLRKVYSTSSEMVAIPSSLEAILEGKRIFQYRGCEACHGEHLEGLVYLDNPAIGQVITPNLTNGKGGIAPQMTSADWLHSIRHGLRPDGTPLLFMPSTEFFYLSDVDLGRLIAYILAAPPIDNEMPPSQLSFTGRIVMNLTKQITFLPAELIPHDSPRPSPPEPGVTPEYGEYLALSCQVCHGITLSGGEIPGFPAEWPPAPNLTFAPDSRLPSWGEQGFIQILRNGKKHGRAIDSTYMPWTSYRHMTDDELRAVYAYLASLPAKEFGNR
jgi:mono/diheme cytochrome c family protein